MKKLLLMAVVAVLLSLPAHAQLLRVGMINQDPDPVRAGDVVKVRFKLENLWEETKYNVKVEIVPEYPFTLYTESGIKDVGRVDGTRRGGGAVYFDFKLRVDHGASDGDHEVTMRVDDGSSVTELKEQFFIDVEKEKIAVKPYIAASDLVTSGRSGSFTIEVANAGGIDVEALELTLLPSDDYRLLSTSDYVYLGDLKVDDTESEDFGVYVPEGKQGVSIPVQLDYVVKDKDYTERTDLTLNLLTMEEARKVGLVKKNNAPPLIGAVIVLIVAVVIIRRVRKR